MPTPAKVHKSLLDTLGVFVAISVLSLSMFLLSTNFNQPQEVRVLGARIDLEEERSFWLNVVTKTPSYRDGWFELAKIEQELGNTNQSEKYLKKAFEVDPNYAFIVESK